MIDQRIIADLEKRNKIYNLDMFDKSLSELIEYFLEASRWDLASVWISNRVNMYMCAGSIDISNEDRGIDREKFVDSWEDQRNRCNALMEKKLGEKDE